MANAWGLTGGAQNVGNNDSTTTSAPIHQDCSLFFFPQHKQTFLLFFFEVTFAARSRCPVSTGRPDHCARVWGDRKNHSIQIPGVARLHGSVFLLAVQVMFWNYPTSLGCEHTPIELEDCQWLSYIQGILEWEKFKLDQFWQWWPMSSWVAEATPRAASPPSWPLGVDNEITSDA